MDDHQVRLTLRLHAPRITGLHRMVGLSVLGHVSFVVAVMLLPGILPRSAPPRWDQVMIGALVEMPAGGGPPPAAPAPAAQPEPAPQPAAAKPAAVEPPPPARKKARPEPRPEPAAPSKKKPDPVAEPAAPKPAATETSAQSATSSSAAQASEAAAAAPTGDGGKAGIGLSVGSGTSFPHDYYVVLLHNKLQANYAQPLHPSDDAQVFSTRVVFTLARNGTISDVRVEMPSPYPPLDDAALRAVYRSAPFPPLPPTFTQDTVSMGATFTLQPPGL